jgi:hypothetical protein
MKISRRSFLAGTAGAIALSPVSASARQEWARRTAATRRTLIALLGGNPISVRGPLAFRAVAESEDLGTFRRQLCSFTGPGWPS